MTPVARRQAVAHACTTHEVSERRACQALGVDRSSVRYRSRRPGDCAVRLRIRELAQVRRRFGYRRLHFLLRREGLAMNQKRFRRLYREEGLQVRKRGGRKRALGLRAPLAPPTRPNERWSLDFVSDTSTDGRRRLLRAGIMSVTGHKKAAMVSLYVEDANKRVQSSAAILKLENARSTNTGKHASRRVANSAAAKSK